MDAPIRGECFVAQRARLAAPAARVEHMSAPALAAATGTFYRSHFNGTEEVVGFRLTPEITLRIGHRAREAFNATTYIHSGTMSLVWWKRWM